MSTQMNHITSINPTELRYQLALSRAPKIGATTFRRLLQAWPTAEALFNASAIELQQSGLSEISIQYLHNPPWNLIDRDLAWQNHPNHHVIAFSDARYPALLKEISDPPPVLFVVGDPLILSQQQIAIVGSRNPTKEGCETAATMATQLVQLGFCVTSGLALGIDAAAHRGTLQAAGKTIAVLGNGLDIIYPYRHQALANEIMRTGALVSELSPDAPPYANNFPRRNRIISGLCIGTLVVEATLKSGSLITAKEALSQNREVFAIPGSIYNPLARGCHQLIQQGAKLVESVADIIAELAGWLTPDPSTTSDPSGLRGSDAGTTPPCSLRSARTGTPAPASPPRPQDPHKLHHPKTPLEEDQQKLVECIGFEVTAMDHIVMKSQYAVPRVATLLLELELQGHIKAVPGGYVRES